MSCPVLKWCCVQRASHWEIQFHHMNLQGTQPFGPQQVFCNDSITYSFIKMGLASFLSITVFLNRSIGLNLFSVVLVSQWWLTLHDPVDCSPPGFSVHGVLQARILVAILFSRESSKPRDQTWVSCIAGRFFFFFFTA